MKECTGLKALIVTAVVAVSLFAVSACDYPQTPPAQTVAITPPAYVTHHPATMPAVPQAVSTRRNP